MKRRTFIKQTGLGASALILNQSVFAGDGHLQSNELSADLVIIGGGLGGCAAALAALRNGLSVIMTEETDWIGGQLTQQGVPPDEHPWIERFGSNLSYRQLRDSIRRYYRDHYPLTETARRQPFLNPGLGGVSALCHEPRVSLAVLRQIFSPYISGRKLILLLEHEAISADTEGDQVQSVTVKSTRTGHPIVLHAPYFVDATELGDILPITGTEYVTGFESGKETGEPHAPEEAQPQNMQSCTWCFAMDYLPGEDHIIDKPGDYAFWRDYTPDLNPPWPGKQLSWSYTNPRTLKPVENRYCDPVRESENEYSGFWRYRRIAYKKYFTDENYASDITLVNWPHNDYMLGNLCEISPAERRQHFSAAMQLSYSLLYWMQTEALRPDGGTGWPGLRLRGDVLGTEHGLAKFPYIRESRRIKAEFTVLEQHVGTEARMARTGKPQNEVKAESFHDSVGVGSYRIDLHPSTGGDNYIDISSLPFQIPLGSLIPQRMENLIPACKNIGTTHITNGCYRLHPVEWNIGEAAGMLIVYSIHQKEKPRGIRNIQNKLSEFQRFLHSQGVETSWPETGPR